MTNQAVQSLEAALKSRVRFYDRLGDAALLEAAVGLVDEAAVDVTPTETIPDVLSRLAALGSLDAVAIMVAMNCSHQQVAAALRGLAERSEDIKEGMLIAGLTAIFEEWAEEEIAAGRMIKTICPKTGHALYSMTGKGDRGDG